MNRTIMKIVSFSLVILSVFTLLEINLVNSAKYANAQVSPVDKVSIDTNPNEPEAGQDVQVFVESSLTDLNRAAITWYLNGKTISQGTGITSTVIQAPNAGDIATVIASIKTFEGQTIRKVINITPTTIDLIWETNGYVPPMYRGRAGYTLGNTLTITAIPHFFDSNKKMIDPANLIYTWRKGERVLQQSSGYGKNSVTVESGVIDDDVVVEVEVTNNSSSISGRAALSISSQPPKVRFYEDSDVYGLLLNKSTDIYKLTTSDARIRAVPYYFSVPDLNQGRVKFTWSVNGVESSGLEGNTSINITKNPGSEGAAEIHLSASNLNHIFEQTEQRFNVLFTNNGGQSGVGPSGTNTGNESSP